MKWIRERVLNGELMGGTFLNLGSSLTAEIAGLAGLDWLLIDIEHGAGGRHELLSQLHAVESTPAAPIVRIAWNDPVRFKRILDLGPSGIMVPYVQSAEEARRAVAAMRYPPAGVRGVASMHRACGFGSHLDEYLRSANSQLLTVVQIETEAAVDHADEIAAVDGVDVLFVGPMDLSVSLGRARQWDHPVFSAALNKVVTACRNAGKVAGTLVLGEEQIQRSVADGFSFLALSSDGALVAKGMGGIAAAFRKQQSLG
ncbi:MAG TPA: aldolase/citrate lyase family protein [Terriglobales bacterium]|nr:aldolase/citrate lyase family protein [Terriglobales bacterium]